MGKMKSKSSLKNKKVRLDLQITEGNIAKSKNREKNRVRAEEKFILDSKTSKNILIQARKQHLEILSSSTTSLDAPISKEIKKDRSYLTNINKTDSSDNDSFNGDDNEHNVIDADFYDDIKLNEEDAKAFELFQIVEGKRTKNLNEIIIEKLKEKRADLNSKLSDDGSIKIEEIDPRIREMYENVRDIMKLYRSGKVPKAFKIIPKLRNWEQILYITEPFNWSAAAMYQGTRTFCSVLSQYMTQRFYNLVLLPRVRDDLAEYKRLNVHLYKALQKALFKPAAFMKGIVLPLLESGDCTLREAIIIGSIVAKNSIPVLHSSACLLKICEMQYSAANSIFIRIFLDKRYALPYRVVDAAVAHFLRFQHDKREMPVIWHQSLLTFVQRYKNDISSEQKEALFKLLRSQSHYRITPEIRKELQIGRCRDVEMIEPDPEDLKMNVNSKNNMEVEIEDYSENMGKWFE